MKRYKFYELWVIFEESVMLVFRTRSRYLIRQETNKIIASNKIKVYFDGIQLNNIELSKLLK